MTHTADFHSIIHADRQPAKTATANPSGTLAAIASWLRFAIDELLTEKPADPTASFGPSDWADIPVHHAEADEQ